MSVFDKVRSIFSGNDKPASPVRGNGGPKIWTMPPEMQREFEKGVKYNMKVVLKGMRGTGKSALLARLHGHTFPDKYTASPEISAATIRYQGIDVPEDHGTKVELWDVVDVGIAPTGSSSSTHLTPLADGTTIDVYRGCHCVVFLVDPMRKETLDYVVTESRNVPATTSILVALNFMDRPKPHIVTERDVDETCRRLQRSTTPMIVLASQGNSPERSLSASATWVSISARTSYGLSVLRSFFEIPVAFVHLATLETQMKALYQKVETHQAWMLSERARLNFEEKERSKTPVQEPQQAHPQQQQGRVDVKNPGVVEMIQPRPKEAPPKKEPAAVVAPQPAKKPQPKQDTKKPPSGRDEHSNHLSNDFFGDISDDEPEVASSSSSEDEVPQASPPRRTTGGFTGSRQNSPPNDSVYSAHEASRGEFNVSKSFRDTDAANPTAAPPSQGVVDEPVLHAPIPVSALRNAPVMRDSDCVVGDDAKAVDDDFFGSDSEDDEPANVAPPPHDDTEDEAPVQKQSVPVVSAARPVVTFDAEAPKASIDAGFFGEEDSDEDAAIKPTATAPPPKPTTASAPPQAKAPLKLDKSDSDDEPTPAPVQRRTGGGGAVARRGAPAPVVTAAATVVAPSIDVNALLAQMQSALTNAPPQEDDDEPHEHHEKRHKEKKPKGERREKKEKKKRRDKSDAAEDSGDNEA